MWIAPLREQVVFQVRKIRQDTIGNEESYWDDLFSRWCSCRYLSAREEDGQAVVRNQYKVRFTLRYDQEILALNSLTTRLFFREETYTVDVIDGDSVPRQIITIDATKEKN